MMLILLRALGLLMGVGFIVVVMWCFAGMMIRSRREHDLVDLVSLRNEVDALEKENARLRAALDTAKAVTRGRTGAPARILPLH